MKVTLKKAHAFQRRLEDASNKRVYPSQLNVNYMAFTNPSDFKKAVEPRLMAARDAIKVDVEDIQRATKAICDIQAKLSDAFITHGITPLLTEQANNSRMLRVIRNNLESLKNCSGSDQSADAIMTDLRENFMAAMATASNGAATTGGRRGDIQHVSNNEVIEELSDKVKHLERRQQDITDKLMVANLNNSIELSTETVAVLVQHGIL